NPTHNHGHNNPTHAHGGNTAGNGAHSHGLTVGTYATGGGDGAATMQVGLATVNTHSAGNHPHSFVTDPSRTGLSISASGIGLAIYGNATGISIQSSGGTDGRPRNVAYPYFIRY